MLDAQYWLSGSILRKHGVVRPEGVNRRLAEMNAYCDHFALQFSPIRVLPFDRTIEDVAAQRAASGRAELLDGFCLALAFLLVLLDHFEHFHTHLAITRIRIEFQCPIRLEGSGLDPAAAFGCPVAREAVTPESCEGDIFWIR